jgi:hypothetical protein
VRFNLLSDTWNVLYVEVIPCKVRRTSLLFFFSLFWLHVDLLRHSCTGEPLFISLSKEVSQVTSYIYIIPSRSEQVFVAVCHDGE